MTRASNERERFVSRWGSRQRRDARHGGRLPDKRRMRDREQAGEPSSSRLSPGRHEVHSNVINFALADSLLPCYLLTRGGVPTVPIISRHACQHETGGYHASL